MVLDVCVLKLYVRAADDDSEERGKDGGWKKIVLSHIYCVLTFILS